MAFRSENWILVCDMNEEYSVQQVEKINELGYNIKGAIRCDDEKYRNSDICSQIPAFPAFCNTDTHSCFTGLRDTAKLFDELQHMSDNS